jgi:hypothetical protein
MTTPQRPTITRNIVRHIRPPKSCLNSNLGGVTLVFDLFHNESKYTVGYSVCSSDDNFSKFRGISIAKGRKEFCTKLDLNQDISLVDNVIQVLVNAPHPLVGNEARLLAALTSFMYTSTSDTSCDMDSLMACSVGVFNMLNKQG